MNDRGELGTTVKRWKLEKFGGDGAGKPGAKPVEVMVGGDGLDTKVYRGEELREFLGGEE